MIQTIISGLKSLFSSGLIFDHASLFGLGLGLYAYFGADKQADVFGRMFAFWVILLILVLNGLYRALLKLPYKDDGKTVDYKTFAFDMFRDVLLSYVFVLATVCFCLLIGFSGEEVTTFGTQDAAVSF